ncbi:hypothetical protein L3X38_031765 [Prunus dulcis]|uniref:Transposable element protein n=1 Tax=Prunus dulcis TaxID=3755 RepID=A0AAD4VDU8_PRUDU|nr:hypothetical protein L3X38_031765 [Prunus dulcis]
MLRLENNLYTNLIAFMRQNAEVFVWAYSDMLGISPEVISYRLSIEPVIRLVRQKQCAYDPERYEAMKNEVKKLYGIGFIREVDYPSWWPNVVLVRKPKADWCMCVGYTNLNHACPRYNFLLPQINQLVDAMAGQELLNFVDAYFSYN